MVSKSGYYWQVPMPEWDFPVRLTERTNQKKDIATSDWSLHWHESLELQYIVEGSITFSCGGMTKTLYPGDCFFAGWCIPHHAVAFEDNTRYFVLQVNPDWLVIQENDLCLSHFRDLMIVHAASFEPFILQDQTLCCFVKQIVKTYREKGFGWELDVKGQCLRILARLFAAHFHMLSAENMVAPVDATLHYSRQVLSYLANHYTSSISMDDLVQEVGLTKSYICRLFKRHTGCTITEYVNRLRCYQAIYLIENGHSVTEVASAVGFNDYNYFSRVFKKITGYRPSGDMSKIREDVKHTSAQLAPSADAVQ